MTIAILDTTTAVDALAADGSMVHLRPMVAADTAAVRDLHLSVSHANRYLRFFTENRSAAELYAARLAERTPDRGQVVLLAEHNGQLAGVGCYEPLGPDEAEVAFLLVDSQHGLGIGTLLLEYLAATARSRGVSVFRADVLSENHTMLRVFTDSGFTRRLTLVGSVTEVALETALTPLTISQITSREQRAEDLSLASVLAPRSVAVIGFGFDTHSGLEQLRELQTGGFLGSLASVNPEMTPIRGLITYPSIAAVPGQVDLAILTVPLTQVAGLVEECGAAGVHSVVITTASSGIGGAPGAEATRGLVAAARRHGTRIVGPGSLGVLNTDPGVALNVGTSALPPRPGGLSMAVQSGAVGRAVRDHADRSGVGLAEFVCLGEKADVSGNDLLLHWWREPRTRVIGLQLDSFGNPAKFARITRLVCRDKPILVVLGDRAHTGPDPVVAAVLAQSGVLRLDTVPALLDVARVLADQPPPGGRRLAIIGNSDGLDNLACRAAWRAELTVPHLSRATQEELRDLAPADALRVVLASGEVDAVLVTLSVSRLADATHDLAEVCAAAATNPAIPVLAACVGARAVPGLVVEHGIRLPVFEFPELAVQALGHAADYAAWRRHDPGTVPILARGDVTAAGAAIRAYLVAHPESGSLPALEAAHVLNLLGLTVAAAEGMGPRISMFRDSRFGPILALGPAGTAPRRRILRGLPLTDVDAVAMIDSWVDLTTSVGLTALTPAEVAAAVVVLHRVALLAEGVPEIAELDLEPVLSGPENATVAGVRIGVAEVTSGPDPLLRRLS